MEINVVDKMKALLSAKNDAELGRKLATSPVVISKIRNGVLHVGPTLLIKLHEETGFGTRDIKNHLGIK